jgi:hypothetical protein
MANELQVQANRANATVSTGPLTAEGKAIASRNATRHGILTGQLLLDHEDRDEFNALVEELHDALAPVGAVELVLVERIAAAIWRQRRLLAAETAELEIDRRPAEIAHDLGNIDELHLGYRPNSDILEPYDKETQRWCSEILAEYDLLEDLDLDTIKGKAPLIFEQIEHDAAEDKEQPDVYLEQYPGGGAAYFSELVTWCRRQLDAAEIRPRVLALAEQVRRRKLILPIRQLAIMARYQTTLDNQLYKALRALREAQEWRQAQERSEADGGG